MLSVKKAVSAFYKLVQKRSRVMVASLVAVSTVAYFGFGSALLVPQTVGAKTVSVCSSGCDFTEIQAAITDVANDGGGTVNVQAGTYSERLTLASGVTVQGAGAGSSILTGPLKGSNSEKVTGASNATISGFTITKTGAVDFGIYNAGASPTIKDNVITGFDADGINNVSGAAPTIQDNQIYLNGAAGAAGIHSTSAGDIKIHGNEIYSNGSGTGYGIEHISTNGIIYDNEIYANFTAGILNQNSSPYIFENTIYDNADQDYGIEIQGGSPNIVDNVIGRVGQGNDIAGIRSNTTAASNAKIYGNTISYNGDAGGGAIMILIGGTYTIVGNELSHSEDDNIEASAGTLTVQNNYIHNAGESGINITNSAALTASSNRIVENGLDSGNGINDGVCSPSVSIHHNLIYDNKGDGYEVTSGTTCTTPTIYSNVIDSNDAHGIDADNETDLEVEANSITNNTLMGITNGGAGVANAPYNNFYNNAGGNYDSIGGFVSGTGSLEVNPRYLKDNTTQLTPLYALQSVSEGYGENESGLIDSAEAVVAFEDDYRPPARGGVRGDIGAYGAAIIKPASKVESIVVGGESVADGGTVNISDATPQITGITGQDLIDAGSTIRVYKNGVNVGQDSTLDFQCSSVSCSTSNHQRSSFDITTSTLGTDGSYTLTIVVLNEIGVESDAYTVTVNLATSAQNSSLTSFAKQLSATQNSTTFSVEYEANGGVSGIDYIELYYQKDSTSGSYTKYTTSSNSSGQFTSSPITFDTSSTGDGVYYFYTVAVDNAANTEAAPSTYDASTTVTTASGSGSPGQITDLEIYAFNVKDSTMELQWTAPDDGTGNAVASYDVRFLHSYLTEGNWALGTPIEYNITPGAPGTRERLVLPVNPAGTAGQKTDYDRDGLTDYMEAFLWGTSPVTQDTDGDGYSDATETFYGYSPVFAFPYKPDADGDGLNDSWEDRHGLDKTAADTDGDGHNDKKEIDGKYDPRHINPESNLFDKDGDGLTDYEERYIFGTNESNPDTDLDGFDDKAEVQAGFDPVKVYYFGIKSENGAGVESTLSNRVYRYAY